MEYTLHVQRLSSGEHKVNAYPASGSAEAIHHTYSSWEEFKTAFSKYMDESETEWLDSILAKSSFGVDVFRSRRVVTSSVLADLGFK